MKRFVSFLISLALVAGISVPGEKGVDSAPLRGCEPAADVHLNARTVSIIERGGTARAIIEFSIDSRMPLTSVRIAGSRFSRFGGARALAVGDLDRLLRRSRTRGVRYAVDLENGVEHHLIFEAEAEDSSGRLHRSQAYVRVNLDQSLEPEQLDGLLEVGELESV